MPNISLKLLQDARALPESYQPWERHRRLTQAPGTASPSQAGRSASSTNAMNKDGDYWWSNDWNLLVDASGDLWELHLGDDFFPNDGGGRTIVNLKRVDGEQLRTWHVNN